MSVRWCHLLPEMHSGHQLTCQCPAFNTSDHSAAPVTRPVSILVHTHTHTHTAPVLSNTSVQATAMSKSRTRCQLSVKTCATNFKQMTGQSEESFSLWIRSVQWDSQAETFPHPQVTLWFKRCRHSGTVLLSSFGGCLHTHTLFFFLTVLRMPTHWKRPRCWERLKAGEEAERGLDGRMVFPTQWRESEGQGGLVCCSPWSHKSWTRLGD